MKRTSLHRRAAVIVFALVLSGCANLDSIHHTYSPDDGTSVSIDAKQRVVYSVNKTFRDGKGNLTYQWRAVCAEPSPDAIAAISASTGVSAETLKAAVSAAFGIQGSAASIGLRTQTIQILRDAMYRLCEGYASGALDDIGFTRLQRRYQNIMLGLLAIEQLTGVVVAKQAILSGASEASVSRSLLEVNRLLDQAKAQKKDTEAALKDAAAKKTAAETALAVAKKEYDDEKTKAGGKDDADAVKKVKAEKLDPAQKAADDATKQATAAKKADDDTGETVTTLTEAVKQAAKVHTAQATKGAFDGGGYTSTINAQTVQHLAGAVQEIVKDIAGRDYTRETCLDFMLSRHIRVLDEVHHERNKVAMQFCAGTLLAEAARLQSLSASAQGENRAAMQRQIDVLNAQATSIRNAIDAIPVPPKPQK